MLIPKKDLKLLWWNHFSKLFDTWVLNWYDFRMFHKKFKNFDDKIIFISTNERKYPIYRLTFTAKKLNELFGLWKGYIKILFKNDEAYLYLSKDNIIKLWKDVVLVENLFTAEDFFSSDAVNEDKCYYLEKFEEDKWDSKKKNFIRIEFYKPWFFYLQDFRSFEFWWSGILWHCWGWNDKYEIRCPDIISLINDEKIIDEEKYDINEEESLDKFTGEEIKIIKFICYLYQINEKSFERIIRYFKKHIACNMIEWLRWD